MDCLVNLNKIIHLNIIFLIITIILLLIITFKKFVTVMFYKLYESVCNRIHHLLEYMGSTLKGGHGLTMGTKSLKVLPIY